MNTRVWLQKCESTKTPFHKEKGKSCLKSKLRINQNQNIKQRINEWQNKTLGNEKTMDKGSKKC